VGKTVSYATFCCPKDIDRLIPKFAEHAKSHGYNFDKYFLILQRCDLPDKAGWGMIVPSVEKTEIAKIRDEDYPAILHAFGIRYPDPVLDELTHGWGAPHFWAHHMVNHLRTLQMATTDYIVFADADCYMKDQPEGKSWVTRGVELLESDPSIFVISPNDGSTERRESIMSQQMFLVNRRRMTEMEFIPWEGKFIEGGPFQEFYGLLEGWIYRHMEKNNLCRYVLGPEYRYWHKEWH
jgi:hypothetical protein